ncbi:adhesion G protein-coupled receptor L4 [Hippocampus zosterae]|uniref:adhesion G protein-coupled receptor L4 n=1 Tax=Hippocampus zosterae TaxID=109293 RepID=UPI00223DE8E8|nr:adhesion G protein-coupled receptor L4 [Hippocampus zosterae]
MDDVRSQPTAHSLLKGRFRTSAIMESSLWSPMKLILLTAWLSSMMDPCRLSDICDSCHKLATCRALNGSNEACFCRHGYTGDGTTFCNDDNECQNVTNICGNKGNCTNTMGSYYCTCLPGYISTGQAKFQTNDGTECRDIDECEAAQACGPNSHCHNINGSFYCTCQRDYIPTSGAKHFYPKQGARCKDHPQKHCHDNIGCITRTVNKTLEYMSNLTEPLSLLNEIAQQSSGDLTSVQVIAYVEALSLSTSLLATGGEDQPVKPAVVHATLTKLAKAVNNLVEKDELVAWGRIEEERREQTVTKLLHTVEESALALAHSLQTPNELQIKDTQMEMKLFTFDANHKKDALSSTMGGNIMTLTPKMRPKEGTNESVSVVFVRYDSIGDILKPSIDPGVTDYSRYAETGEITVNSQVVAAAIKPADVYQLDHVSFTLRHVEPVDLKTDITKCAFWEYTIDSLQGHWATHGCKTVHVSSNATTCTCNHLTHFAILMSSGRSNFVAHQIVLTRITQLGMIISIICLSMCIFTFWFFSEIQSTRTTIHKNLCCSLFMAEFIFLVGINMNTHKLFCSVIAGLLHYFFLAAFAWMCIEGIHLYLIVVGVIYNKGFLHRNFYIFGYGSPAVVVAISATLGSKYYGTDKMCWLSTENHFIWSFIGPACLIILVNLLAFGVIIYKVYRHTVVKKPEISHYENIRSCARGAVALLFVLGATWTFGVLHILYENTLTAYLFTITNTFQGMFIFIFLCVLSRKIQEEYYRLFKNAACCFECLR